MAKKFAWSWSKLKNYRVCPKRHYEIDIAKTTKEEDSDALHWGDSVHKAMSARIDKGVKLPPMMEHYEGWPAAMVALRDKGWTVKTEQKLAMSEAHRPTSFFDNATWFRGVCDVLAIAPEKNAALSVDWKTGKISPDAEQLALNAALIFSHYPDINLVDTVYVWLGNEDQTRRRYGRMDMMPLWNSLLPEVKVMEEASRTLTYPPKPGGLCKQYCPVSSCPFFGKGSR